MALQVRTLTAEEANSLKRVAGARTAPHRVVQRAQIIWASAHGEAVPLIAFQGRPLRLPGPGLDPPL